MIIDTFMFFNELDILEIRLNELDSTVDRFVLVESAHTLAGVQKPFFFEENKRRFERYLPRIKHIKLPALPSLVDDSEESRFRLEAYQRDAILWGLVDEDIDIESLVLISDVDEIPRASAVVEVSKRAEMGCFYSFLQSIYFHYFDSIISNEFIRKRDAWVGTVATTYGTLLGKTPTDVRLVYGGAACFLDSRVLENRYLLKNAGWHLTYFGGEQASKYKMANFSHGANDRYGRAVDFAPITIDRRIAIDLLPWSLELEAKIMRLIRLELGANLPANVLENLDEYYHHFKISF